MNHDPVFSEHTVERSASRSGSSQGDFDHSPSPSPPVDEERETPRTSKGRATAWQRLKGFYERNIGLLLVFLAQMFGSLMSMTTRLLETGFDTKFHALQIIFVRMLATAVLGSLWMGYKKVPDFPFGDRRVRGLLLVRGTAGFIGLSGSYYSLSYLNISDATVISFLVPTLTAFIAFLVMREPFTRMEAGAGLIALVGVLFIARPSFLFSAHDSHLGHPDEPRTARFLPDKSGGLVPVVPVTPSERAVAVVCAVIGSLGAASAYTTIRLIGKRAHSLVSVNYFAFLATAGSCLIILIHPGLHFQIPHTATQWILLVGIGVAGFLLQFLLTEGLQREKAGRAMNLTYTQMVFALIIERVVWGTTPPINSLLGSALIIVAAVWVSLQKNKVPIENSKAVAPDEETGLLAASEGNSLRGS
ncbi:DUF6 domain protein [Xylariales sp. AK1849]|nr:DUF6 domain protein [Xylariales sp. AK1849]